MKQLQNLTDAINKSSLRESATNKQQQRVELTLVI